MPPVRTLIWNIDNFQSNTIDNPDTVNMEPGTAITLNQAAAERLNYMLNTMRINGITDEPKIIVVLEMLSDRGVDAPGQLVLDTTLAATLQLLTEIRTRLGAHWAVVPPQQNGTRYGVAVFYDTRTLIFSGPYVWPGGGPGSVAAAPGAGVAPNDYPPTTAGFFVGAPRAVPAGALGNVGAFETQLAAQTRFAYKVGHINAGTNIDLPGGQYPYPYLVTFAETDGVAPPHTAVIRNLSVFAIHGPNSPAKGTQFLQLLAQMQEVSAAFGATETRVLCGDFNLNLMDPALVITPTYTQFITDAQVPNAITYNLAISPNAVAPAPINGYRGYFASHTRPLNRANYWSDPRVGNEAYYPGYKYIGNAGSPNQNYALDNFFTAYGPGTAPVGLNGNVTILNSVVGSPFTAVPAGDRNGPTGTLDRAISMASPDLRAPEQISPNQTDPLLVEFREWRNYGHIISTSDHMAVVMDL